MDRRIRRSQTAPLAGQRDTCHGRCDHAAHHADALKIAGDNPDIGEVREELEASYAGPAVAIGVNPKYVIELLSQMADDTVRLELCGELDPVLIRPAGDARYLGVVMPMRI